MMTRDERLRYLAQIEAAQTAQVADPEMVAEYERASQAWDSSISPSPVFPEDSEDSTDKRPSSPPARS